MNRVKMFAALMMLMLGCWLTGIAAADDKKEDKDGGDKAFAKKASAAGLAEVNVSELALRFSQNPNVKRFAQQMVINHKRANDELTTLANRKSIPLAKGMDDKHKKKFEDLSKMSGSEFDSAFMKCMVADHEEAVKLFEKESKDGEEATFKEWAGKTLPILKKHLEMARNVEKTVNKDEKAKDRTDK